MRKGYFILMVTLALIGLSGCDSLFERQVPPHQMVGENAITNETSAIPALNGCYSYLDDKSLNAKMITGNECILGLFDESYNKQTEEEWIKGIFAFDNYDILSLWKSAYSIVNACNNFIYYVEKLDDSKFGPNRKTEMLAEARFLRAFAHGCVLRKFGYFFDLDSKYGALIRTEPASLSNNSMPRSTVAGSYMQILGDYDDAILNAPDFTSVYRVSKTAAKAFKADLLMSRGAAGDYEEAIRLADEVLADSAFALEKTYGEVFSHGYNSSELIFSRCVDEVPLLTDNSSSIYQLFTTGVYGPSETYEEYLTKEDARYTETFDSVQVYKSTGAYEKDLVWKKHLKSDRDCPMYFMRLAQLVLIKAEAMLYTNAPVKDIVEVLNILRERSGNTLFEAENFTDRQLLQEEIFAEYVRELGMENGGLFYVAARMKVGDRTKLQLMNIYYTDMGMCVWPIPKMEMENNFEIEQKP